MTAARPLPAIVRIAGLPGSAISWLGSPRLQAISFSLDRLRQSLQRSYSDLSDRIATELSGFSPSERRFLLAVRRDCFNQRDLTKHVESPAWSLIQNLAPEPARRLRDLRQELETEDRSFSSLFEQEQEREIEALYAWSTDPRLLRGLALGAPDVIQALRDRHLHSPQDRRRRKLDLTMLRFVTRAAAKLSPNSTFTLLALCRVKAEAKGSLQTLGAGPVEERSSLHLDRTYLDQLQELLLLAPEIRSLCRVAINDTLEESEAGSFRWIKPGRWQFDPEKGRLVLAPLLVVKTQLDPELLSRIRRSVAEANLYRELASVIGPEQELDRFIELGLLHLLPPWPVNAEMSGERSLLAFLRDRDLASAPLRELWHALARLVSLQRELPTSPLPDRCLDEMRRQVDTLRELGSRFLPVTDQPALSSVSRNSRLFHESVFLLQPAPGAAEIDQAAAIALGQEDFEHLRRIAGALYRFTELFNHRHDLLHSLEHFWRSNFPQDASLPALELFRRASPLWKQYIAFDRERRESSVSTFNPYDLLRLQELARRRERTYRALQEDLAAHDHRISVGTLEGLVEAIPARYHPQVGPSALVQPLPDGSWVLNRLLEGTGRYSSRYISALPPELGRLLADGMAARNHSAAEGEAAELLDLACFRGGTSEVHHPMTPWILEMPGDCIDVPEARKVRLGEIRMHLEEREATIVPRRFGQRLLPVHLTSLNHAFLPSILRFLSVFGPYEARQVFPRAPQVERHPGCLVSERIACDRLVVSRKRWELSADAMAGLSVESLPADRFFLAVQSWRDRFDIPAEAYVYEKIHSPRENLYHYKPQYMNFSSPLMVQLFRAMLRSISTRCVIDEALPSREQYPSAWEGSRAMELQF